jgi:hypothetical protein
VKKFSRHPGKTVVTLSHSELARELYGYLINGEIDLYFPAEKSNTPDFIIIPQCAGEKMLIGIQVKCCDKDTQPLGKSDVIKEAEKFHKVIAQVRKLSKSKRINAVLVMCGTCSYTSKDFEPINHNVKSFVWECDEVSKMGIEVIIINLSTEELRSDFFSLALDKSYRRKKAIGFIESLVKSRNNFSDDYNQWVCRKC